MINQNVKFRDINLANLNKMKSLLKKYDIRPSKRLGQNFLIDRNILKNIADASAIGPDDIVLEIGPGLGTLTQELCCRASRVIAVEKDPRMVRALHKTCGEFKNLEIVEENILNFISKFKTKNEKLPASRGEQFKTQNLATMKIVGNIPYNITSPLMKKFSIFNFQFSITLMVQKEVAERICAGPGDSARGFLSVLVQYYAKPEIIQIVPREAFWPQPAVESAIIKIKPIIVRANPPAGGEVENRLLHRTLSESKHNPEDLFRLVKIGFSARRKQLVNNLAAGLDMPKEKIMEVMKQAKINPLSRAQDLSIEEWEGLSTLTRSERESSLKTYIQ